jgi:hypothetical protein
MKRRSLPLLLPFLAAASAVAEPPPSAHDRIDARVIRAHMEFLSHDLLEGRRPGTRGFEIAARYVAAELLKMGIEPAGDGGTYFQSVPLVESRLVEEHAAISWGDVRLTFGEDFLMGGDPVRPESSVTAPVVFAGYGVVAPELEYDDYQGVSVEGKIVAILSNAPPSFPSEERAHFASNRLKAANAARRGAVGLLLIQTLEDRSRAPWERIRKAAGGPSLFWRHRDGSIDGVLPEIRVSAFLSPAGAEKLFDKAPRSLAQVLEEALSGVPKPFELPLSASLSRRSEPSPVSSENVVGVLEGSDPELRSSYVVYSAHLDHVGIGTAIDGDSIYNGAFDNASGVAVVLEVARAFVSLPVRPRRSILFLFVTAEESGLLGSDYFAHYPTVDSGSIVANVNLDMPLFIYPVGDVIAFGAESSSLREPVSRAASSVGLALSPDPMPQENVFIRSDQYSFVRQGIPAVFLVPGFTSKDPSIHGGEAFTGFLATHYHAPTDDMSRPMDWDTARTFTELNFLVGWEVADALEAPRWKDGNFFAETFGRSPSR